MVAHYQLLSCSGVVLGTPANECPPIDQIRSKWSPWSHSPRSCSTCQDRLSYLIIRCFHLDLITTAQNFARPGATPSSQESIPTASGSTNDKLRVQVVALLARDAPDWETRVKDGWYGESHKDLTSFTRVPGYNTCRIPELLMGSFVQHDIFCMCHSRV